LLLMLRLTDNTQQSISEKLQLTPEDLAKLNFALGLCNTTHAVESLQAHCELSLEDAETLAVALHLLSKVNFTDSMINKPKSVPSSEILSRTTLYIRNLPLTVTQEELTSSFEHYGSVKEVRIQRDKISGEFSGSVFVQYIDPSSASSAQAQMDGKLWGINQVQVTFAIDKKATPLTESSNFPMATSQAPVSNLGATIFIAGIGSDTDVPTVKQLFSRFGEIENARLLTDKNTGISKGVAFVDFKLPVSAAAAIDAMNNQMYSGKTLKVTYATQKSQSSSSMPPVAGYPPFLGAYPDPYGSQMGMGMPYY